MGETKKQQRDAMIPAPSAGIVFVNVSFFFANKLFRASFHEVESSKG